MKKRKYIYKPIDLTKAPVLTLEQQIKRYKKILKGK